jgi:serine protease Do
MTPRRPFRRAVAGSAALLLLGAAAQARPQDVSPRVTPIVQAVRRVEPSVVSVNVTRRERVAPVTLFDEFFAPFVPFGYEREVAGLGSGFAIAPGGVILTNAHVVRGAEEIVVTTDDGRDLPARLLGLDELSDLAVLKVNAAIPVPPFGDSDHLMIGEPALALGNPFGYLLSNPEPTVTVGVVSGVGRDILPLAGPEDDGQRPIYADMIQTDASINPGNSGGPLVNANGEVIGVNSSIFSGSGGSVGLGFAIPIRRALRIAGELREHGYARRAWIGIDVAPAEQGPIGRPRGAEIARVAPNSPADRAGLRPRDRLLAVNGRSVKSPLDWEAELLDLRVGDRAVLAIERDDRAREVTLTVEDLPSLRARRVDALQGLQLVSLTPAIRAERGLRSQSGALIVEIAAEFSRAVGLRPGDLIVQINQWRIETAEAAAQALRYAAGRGAVRIFYEREARIWSTTFYL